MNMVNYNKRDNKKKDDTGFGLYLNHEGIRFSIGVGRGTFIDDDGIHFGGLKLL